MHTEDTYNNKLHSEPLCTCSLCSLYLHYVIWMFHYMYLLCASFHSTTLHVQHFYFYFYVLYSAILFSVNLEFNRNLCDF